MTFLPQFLDKAGYATHFIGKWGLGNSWDYQLPNKRGFQSSLGYLGETQDYCTHESDGKNWACDGKDLMLDGKPATEYGDECSGALYGKRILKILDDHDEEKPIFIYMALQHIHSPAPDFNILKEWVETRFNRAKFVDEYIIPQLLTAEADLMLGNTVDKMKELKMWDNTIFVHASDNGGNYGNMGEHKVEVMGNNYPLRGAKYSGFDGGHRVPAFVTGGLVPDDRRGKTIEGLVHLADWMPTLLGLAGVEMKADKDMPQVDGVDIWPMLTGKEEKARDSLMLGVENLYGATGFINGTYKLLRSSSFHTLAGRKGGCVVFATTGPVFPNETLDATREAMLKGGENMTKEERSGGAHRGMANFACNFDFESLYDIFKDPGESKDLAGDSKYADVLKDMRKMMDSQNATVTFKHIFATNEAEQEENQDEKKLCEANAEKNGGFHTPYETEDPDVNTTEKISMHIVAEYRREGRLLV